MVVVVVMEIVVVVVVVVVVRGARGGEKGRNCRSRAGGVKGRKAVPKKEIRTRKEGI